MDITAYITSTTGLSLRQIAEKSGLQSSKISRQLSGTSVLTMETLRDIARGTGLDMVDLFLKADLITETEATAIRSRGSVSAASDQQLAGEVLRRLEEGASAQLAAEMDKPLGAEVTNLSDRRRKVTADDITEEDLRPHRDAAAYTPKEGEEPDYDSYN